jgi:hypothetical protein
MTYIDLTDLEAIEETSLQSSVADGVGGLFCVGGWCGLACIVV